MTKAKETPPPTLGTRAVLRDVVAGSRNLCAYTKCAYQRSEIMWRARRRVKNVIANVYVGDKWNRVEHFHEECYPAARKPHGKIIDG